jgi:ABC-type lipopolysaccharide export system ATPase subunit
MSEIALLEEEMFYNSEKIEEFEEAINYLKDEYYLTVEGEWEDGKDKSLSNADKRRIEVTRRLNNNPNYVTIKIKLKELKKMQTKKDIELRKLKRQFIRQYCQTHIPI